MRLPHHRDVDALRPDFTAFPLHSELRLAGQVLKFPHGTVTTRWQPREWLATRHARGGVHEPGLVAWLFALGQESAESLVRFFDIGAAYGYFSLVADVVFRNCRTVAVEPNASLASYIGLACRMNRASNVEVANILLSDRDGVGRYRIDNFRIRERSGEGLNDLPEEQLATSTLTTFLEEHSPACATQPIDILKIDTEGWQARFLAPASTDIIQREAVVLLECDSPDKLVDFGASNSDIVMPFVNAGYAAYWCDHRNRSFKVIALNHLDRSCERDGLVALIPPKFRHE